jgi:predicted CXXCH cytochrome family protein
MAGLFAMGFIVFLFVRWILVPSDFGVYGFYRAGALKDAAARPMSYAGRQSCAECHDPVIQERKGSKHEQVGCESCHGPLSSHTSGDVVSPPKPDTKSVCVPCHTKMDGRPATFPQVDFKEHAGDALCVDCHKPHSPKIPQ